MYDCKYHSVTIDNHNLATLACSKPYFMHCNFYTARTICNTNSCSHICAVVDGQDQCFCPVGFELSMTTTCEGMETTAFSVYTNNYYCYCCRF